VIQKMQQKMSNVKRYAAFMPVNPRYKVVQLFNSGYQYNKAM